MPLNNSRLMIAALITLTMQSSGMAQVAAMPALDPQRGVLTFAPAIGPTLPSVVQIMVRTGTDFSRADELPPGLVLPGDGRQQPPSGSSGSGVIVDPQSGLVLTNHHVVAGAREVRVRFPDGRIVVGTIVGSDQATDIAVVKIDPRDLIGMTVAPSDNLAVGDVVMAIGYPFGLDQTVTMGIVSGLGRTGIGLEFEEFIQTDASINSGNSGGALVDSRGRLVGINTAIFRRQHDAGNVGIGYAVPSRIAMAIMDQLVRYGEVQRGRLGVEIEDLTQELAAALRLSVSTGALIKAAGPASSGAGAGLKSGDVVVGIDGKPIRTASQLRTAVGLAPNGGTLRLAINRSGQEIEVHVQIEAPSVSPDQLALLGATFQELRKDHPLARRGVKGMMVASVEAGSPAARNGMAAGDVVESINDRATPSGEAMRAVLTSLQGQVAVRATRGNTSVIVVMRAPAALQNEPSQPR